MDSNTSSADPVFLKAYSENPMARLHRLGYLILGVLVGLGVLWPFVSLELFGFSLCLAVAAVSVLGRALCRQKMFVLRSTEYFTINGEQNQPLPWRGIESIELSDINLRLTMKSGATRWLRLPFLASAERQEAIIETLRTFELFRMAGPLIFPSGADLAIRTERLEIRAAQDRDRDFVVSISVSNANQKNQLGQPTTIEFESLRFQTQLEALKTGVHFWVGVVIFNQAPVGIVSLSLTDPILRQGQIGIDIAEEFQNRGLGSEALKGWVDFIQRRTNLTKLIAGTFVNNDPCRRILEKTGFSRLATVEKFWVKDGEWKEGHWFEKVS